MLGSGSAGNSALVATDHCRILVDGGLSARQLVVRLALCGVTPEQLDGVLLTHEHGDHVCGLEVFCRKFKFRSIATRSLRKRFAPARWPVIGTGVSFAPARNFPFAISRSKLSRAA